MIKIKLILLILTSFSLILFSTTNKLFDHNPEYQKKNEKLIFELINKERIKRGIPRVKDHITLKKNII